jgi:hypothetical protein
VAIAALFVGVIALLALVSIGLLVLAGSDDVGSRN